MKKIIYTIFWIALLICCFILLGFMNKKHAAIQCEKINIHYDYPDQNILVDTDDIMTLLQDYVDSVGQCTQEDYQINKMEELLLGNHYVQDANVYTTMYGNIEIEITQRKPIVRLITSDGTPYYMDKLGMIVPASTKHTARVTVASGYIKPVKSSLHDQVIPPDSIHDKTIHDVFEISKYIQNNDFLHAQIGQIYITKDQEIELIPKIGKHLIEFGSLENMQSKFDKLIVFYKQALGNNNWNKYEKINLKYNNQIVCTKI